MLICRNSEGVHGQRKVGNPPVISVRILHLNRVVGENVCFYSVCLCLALGICLWRRLYFFRCLGTAKELQTFAEHAMATSRIAIEINFPSVVLHLPSKSFFENLYNRIANDLILWQPSAPYQAASGMERSSVYQCPKLDLASQFPQHCFQITEAERSSRFMFQSSAR